MWTFCIIADGIQSSVTVEEGERATLECPGFVPDPDDTAERHALFYWYKARKSETHISNKVAMLDKGRDLLGIFGKDLEGRTSMNRTSGALDIFETKVIDDHHYTCDFRDTAKEQRFTNETMLTITGKWNLMDSHVK